MPYNRDLYQCKDDINVICELLAVKHSNLELDLFSNSVLDAFSEFLSTTNFLLSFYVYRFYLRVLCTIFMITK